MERNSKEWLVPLTGVAFFVLLIVSFVVAGEAPDTDEGASEVVDFYTDNKDSIMAGAGIGTIAASALVFFGAYLRKVLRAAEGGTGILSLTAFIGTVIIAIGGAIDSTISFAMAETAEDIDPTSLQALHALFENDFFPIALGLQVLLLASGISIVRHGALPTWLGWVAIVFGVIAITPIGFVSFMAGALWIVVVSILLSIRARGESGAAPAAPPAV
jgi:hypothetical protein